jgi:hypothetical protein
MFKFRDNKWLFFRKATWLVIGWNLLMLMFLLLLSGGTAYVNGVESGGATQMARGIMTIPLFFVWFIGFLVTGFIWFGTRPKR